MVTPYGSVPPTQPLDDAGIRGRDGFSPIGRVWHDGPGLGTLMLCGTCLLDQARPRLLLAELPAGAVSVTEASGAVAAPW